MSSNTGKDKQISVLLFGLGAIGGFYAFILGQNKNVSLSVIARSNYEAVKENGLHIDSEVHGKHKVNIDHVYKTPSEASPKTFDFIICCHKAIKPHLTPPLFTSISNESTTFVIIQNGVGNEEPFRSTYPTNTIISCVTWSGCVQTSPGLITHNSNENIQLGLFHNSRIHSQTEYNRLTTFSELLKNGGTKFSVEDNIQIARWEKVVWNAAWNPLTALTGLPVQSFYHSTPEAQKVCYDLMEDVISVGKALSVPLKDGLAKELVEKVLGMSSPIYSSMYQDVQAGRALETEVIVGYPMQKARELGLQVPSLRAIYALIVAVDGRLSGEVAKL